MNDLNHYFTLSKPSSGLYKEKGSKFISYAYPIKSENDIKEHLTKLKKEYYDARHICYAYRLGERSIYERANDDGEPKHSAGDPILGQIKSADLTNTLVAVVRYFGGTKLGVSGLINAYKTASQEAIENGDIEKKTITDSITISFPYEHTNEVMRAVKDFHIEITNQEFTDSCIIIGNIIEGQLGSIQDNLKLLDKVSVTLNDKKPLY